MVERFIHVRQEHPDGWRISPVATPTGDFVHYSDYADLERQIAELRENNERLQHKADQYDSVVKALSVCDGGRYRNDTIESCVLALKALEAAEAENARLRALPLKDEVERMLEDVRDNGLIYWEPNTARGHDRKTAVVERLDALLSRLRAGEQDRDGLSEWAGWDKSRDPWSETKHKDAVLEALFRGPWSVEDAAALIGFIDRTWTKRPASPSVSEGGRRNG